MIRKRNPGAQKMINRRLIYSNLKDKFPKFALFAARKIEANTELLL
jgi:hypothetical protein